MAGVEAVSRGVPEIADEVLPARVSAQDLECRVCELETENGRLRLLVGELLVANQKLRERAAQPGGAGGGIK
jgi:hypothetical protein